MVVSIVLPILGFIGMVVFIYGKLTNYSMKTTIVKTVTSLLFVALAIYLFIYKQFPMIGAFIIASTTLGMLGDVFLALKRVYSQKVKLFTFLGFYAFLAGHMVLISGLFASFYINGNVLYIILPFVLGLISGTTYILLDKKMGIDFGKLRPAGFIYISFVSTLAFTTLSLAILYRFNYTPLIILFVGGFLFMISDMILQRTYFGKPTKFLLVSTTVTYYFAQFLIALSIFFL